MQHSFIFILQGAGVASLPYADAYGYKDAGATRLFAQTQFFYCDPKRFPQACTIRFANDKRFPQGFIRNS
ncbi:hypothetical protein FACS1894181_06240 [Bacteroidia bacterium]|nr:hypothetical protein FACS1894181_06240 [Bacteroidia bacterium]